MITLFISYSSIDKEMAEFIHAELEKRGIDAFVDYENLRAGDKFHAKLAAEIKNRDLVLFLVSEHSVVSQWVISELQWAFKHKKRIVPVALDGVDIPDDLFFVDLVHRDRFDRSPRAIQRMCEAIGIDGKPPVVPAPPPDDTVGATRRVAPTPRPPVIPRSKVYDILPSLFAWIDIPAGKVTLVNTWDYSENVYLKKGIPQTFEVPAFTIAKYPVTNAQYRVFVDTAKGYTQRKWWTDAGWSRREQEKWTELRFWTDQKWNGDEYPVVGVSWYEAVAFCRWLSEASGENILLPTEQQWQRAAQGDDGRVYPWGNEWDVNRCNTRESGVGKTTPVTAYEGKGDSPFGVTDMAGNVWEWCSTDYRAGSTDLNGTNVRVLRGGSWVDNPQDARAAYRGRSYPFNRNSYWGFRVVCPY